MNVSFEYLYRDSANYKNWGEVVLRASPGIELAEIEHRIEEQLIDGLNFVAEDVNVPTLYFWTSDRTIDHGWHEYVGVSWTNESPSDGSVEEMILKLEISKRKRLP